MLRFIHPFPEIILVRPRARDLCGKSMKSRDAAASPYEFPIPGPAWTRGTGMVAGVFLLEGRCHVVAQESPAERDLLERGALQVAILHFGSDPREGSRAGQPVRVLGHAEALERFSGTGLPTALDRSRKQG